jgi:sialic acid synthase SpsE
MIRGIQLFENVLGNSQESILPEESESYYKGRRSIFSKDKISRGEIITQSKIKIVRTGNKSKGVAPKYLSKVLGKKAKSDIDREDPIEMKNLE